MDTRPIGVFDSGLGGLTAVRQLRRVLPGEDIVYFGDTGRVPYGSRGRDVIVQYARQDIRFLLSRDVKFVLAACGTVSSTYPPEEAARIAIQTVQTFQKHSQIKVIFNVFHESDERLYQKLLESDLPSEK